MSDGRQDEESYQIGAAPEGGGGEPAASMGFITGPGEEVPGPDASHDVGDVGADVEKPLRLQIKDGELQLYGGNEPPECNFTLEMDDELEKAIDSAEKEFCSRIEGRTAMSTQEVFVRAGLLYLSRFHGLDFKF